MSVVGDQSTGSGGRAMVFLWSATGIVDADANSTKAEVAAAEAALAEAVSESNKESNEGDAVEQSFKVLNKTSLATIYEGGFSTIALQLTLTNFLASSSVSEIFEVKLSDEEIPALEIIGGTSQSFKRTNAIQIEAAGLATSCVASRQLADRGLIYEWALYERAKGSNSSLAMTGLSSTAKNQRYFKLPAFKLETQVSYELVVVATDKGGTAHVNNTASCVIAIESGAIIADIDGGSTRQFWVNERVELSANSSYDADIAEGQVSGLAFEWNCTALALSQQDACAALNLKTATDILEFEADTLGVGTYVFGVRAVASDGRADDASVEVVIVAEIVPSVSISRGVRAGRLNAAVKQTFLGGVEVTNPTSDKTITSTWTLLSGDLDDGAALEDVARTAISYTAQLDNSSSVVEIEHDLVLDQST